MKIITVIGAGTMGNGIAHIFAQKGFNVRLVDISHKSLEKALETIKKNLDRMLQKEKITESIMQNTLDNLSTFTDIKKGTIILKSHIALKRPAHGIEPKYFKDVIGMKAQRDIRDDEVLQWTDFE